MPRLGSMKVSARCLRQVTGMPCSSIPLTSWSFQGEGDHHDKTYDAERVSQAIYLGHVDEHEETDGCSHTMEFYPSVTFIEHYESNNPVIITTGVTFVFFLSIICFLVYDVCVDRRQKNSMDSAVRSNAIVSSLFPKAVRDRLLDEHSSKQNAAKTGAVSAALPFTESGSDGLEGLPIADLFVSAMKTAIAVRLSLQRVWI